MGINLLLNYIAKCHMNVCTDVCNVQLVMELSINTHTGSGRTSARLGSQFNSVLLLIVSVIICSLLAHNFYGSANHILYNRIYRQL